LTLDILKLYKCNFDLSFMAFKLINAAEARTGAAIMVDGVACIVRSNDISKTGKHGHAKCRIEAIGIIDGKKKVFAMGGHDRLDVPMINKNKAQLMSISGLNATVMDLESFETFELSVPEDLKDELKEEDQVEYWDVEGSKIIKRKL
tara:strand:- start:343 stop:783 length:441 start_codon:yes stop_codon:yes gene_type:complete